MLKHITSPYPHNGKRNFRVSRPTPSHNAEDLLLQNLETFVRPGKSDAIILYTWLEPCPRCVQRLVSALGRYTTTGFVYCSALPQFRIVTRGWNRSLQSVLQCTFATTLTLKLFMKACEMYGPLLLSVKLFFLVRYED